MFLVNDIVVDGDVATARFGCDLAACHGACCTMPGGRGAPLTDNEAVLVEESTEAASKYLSERNKGVLKEFGGVEGKKGDRATRCIDNRDCVYVYYEGPVAKCAIERAYFNGETTFRKPLSCHLFPIRVDEFLGGHYLRYEEIRECEPARERGATEGIPVYRFLKDALTRAFGEEFYAELIKRIEG